MPVLRSGSRKGASEAMGKRRSVPQDLMGTILSEGFEADDEKLTLSESRGSPGAVVSWDERPERVGITFNLSKQLGAELERLRLELEGDVRPSRSEIAEVALRIAIEDARERGRESELVSRLSARTADRATGVTDEGGRTTRRSVDESGWIFETTHDENGDIVDEVVVGTVADLPVVDEYVDEQGRLVSVAKDELGNTFEQIMDEGFNTLGTRILPTQDQDAR
jgi:hypothetical protein